jgi:hypothetical protein
MFARPLPAAKVDFATSDACFLFVLAHEQGCSTVHAVADAWQ